MSISDLSLFHCIDNGRKKIGVLIPKEKVNNHYSIWIQLSIEITDMEYKVFYTQNTNYFYQNQVINFKYREKEGRRHKMQILSTKYPHNIYGDLWGTGGWKTIENYLGSKCLINYDYLLNYPNNILIDYANKVVDGTNQFVLRIKTPSNYLEVDKITEEEFKKVILFDNEKIQVVNFENLADKLEEIRNDDIFGIVIYTNLNDMREIKNILPEDIYSDLEPNLMFNNSVNLDKNTISVFTYKYNEFASPLFNRNYFILDKSVKRIGEGPIVIRLEDNIGPRIDVLEPISQIYSNEFDDNIIPISMNFSDQSKVSKIVIKFTKEDDLIEGSFTDIILPINASLIIQEDSIVISTSEENGNIICNFNPSIYLDNGKYVMNIYAEDNAYYKNISIYKHNIYIDKEPPYLTDFEFKEIRISSINQNFQEILRVQDNFSHIKTSLKKMEFIFDYYNGSDWENGIYLYNYENISYGLHFVDFPITELCVDGNYKTRLLLEDYIGNINVINYNNMIIDNSPPEILFDLPSELVFTLQNESYQINYTTNEYTHGYIVFKNEIDSFCIYDEGNINDIDYVRGEIDELSVDITSENVGFYLDGHYTMMMIYEDDLGNRAIYGERPVKIDRHYPQITHAIAEPFVSVGVICQMKVDHLGG